MLKKKTLLVLIIVILLGSAPVYSQGVGATNAFKIVGQLIFLIVVFIAMIFLTSYGTKLVSKNAGGMIKSKYIQLLDAINIPGGSKIVITKINNKIYILSIDSNGSNVIDIIEEKDFLIIENDYDKNVIKNKLSDCNIIKKIKLFYDNLINKRIKDKEDKNDEKED